MLNIAQHRPTAAATAEHPAAQAGRLLARYGLVVAVAWIGALKYTAYEATAIQPLVAHSPLLSWLYTPFSVRTLAAVLGTAEITAALLIAFRLPAQRGPANPGPQLACRRGISQSRKPVPRAQACDIGYRLAPQAPNQPAYIRSRRV